MIGFPDPLPLAKTYSYSICRSLTWNNSKIVRWRNGKSEKIVAAAEVQAHTMWRKCFHSAASFPLTLSACFSNESVSEVIFAAHSV